MTLLGRNETWCFRRVSAAWGLLLLLLGSGPLLGGRAESRPNIVFFLADDLGWADLTPYGNRFHDTPYVERLAAQGMLFTDAYAAAPVCSPTRASILSGQYPARLGLTAHIPGHWRPFERLVEPPNAPHLPLDVLTLAEVLRDAGYATAHFGKWHLGPETHYPDRQGFEVSIVTSGRHFAPRFRTHPDLPVPEGTALTDFLTEQALQFMEQHQDRPFLVYLCHYAVHIPLEAKEALAQKYRLRSPVPGTVSNPLYAAMVEDLDYSLGRILEGLQRLGLDNRTLLVFFSDNGGLYRIFHGKGPAVTTNGILRDEKGTLYEGGIRVPLILRWPGVVPPGSVCRIPVTSVDFYPTFLEAAGIPAPSQILDGQSLMPLLTGSASFQPREIYFHYPHYHHSRPAAAVRQGRYKYLRFFDTQVGELYDLEEDPGERNNLAAQMPDKARELEELLGRWQVSVAAQMPQPNPQYDPRRAGEWWSRNTGKPIQTNGVTD